MPLISTVRAVRFARRARSTPFSISDDEAVTVHEKLNRKSTVWVSVFGAAGEVFGGFDIYVGVFGILFCVVTQSEMSVIMPWSAAIAAYLGGRFGACSVLHARRLAGLLADADNDSCGRALELCREHASVEEMRLGLVARGQPIRGLHLEAFLRESWRLKEAEWRQHAAEAAAQREADRLQNCKRLHGLGIDDCTAPGA